LRIEEEIPHAGVVAQFENFWAQLEGVIPTGAVLQAEGEPALSEVEGDLARIATAPGNSLPCEKQLWLIG
jgi:hypothetical protein